MAGKVLLVDPNESSQRTIELTLHAEFLEVVTVGDAAAGRRRAHADDPGLVVAAVSLPDASGAEFLRGLRSDPATAGIPTLLIGDDVDSLQEAVRGGGIDGILGRPFRTKDLIDQVYKLLREPSTGSIPAGVSPDGGAPRSDDGPESAEVVDEASGGAGGDFFDLAGELDRGDSLAGKRPKNLRQEAEDLAREIGYGDGRDRTVVVSRDDLQALRNGIAKSAREPRVEPKPASSSERVDPSHTMMMTKQELDSHLRGGAGGDPGESDEELGNYQTMMMSRDELAELRGKISASKVAARATPAAVNTPVGGVKARELNSPATAPNPYSAATVRPKTAGAPGSDESIESLLRGAVHATEDELLRMLQRIKPDMAEAVRRVAHELIDRVARRVALEAAEKRVEEEIARLKKSLRP